MLQYIWAAWLRARGGLAAHEAVYDSFDDCRIVPIKLMRAMWSTNALESL
jgi:hypothetical protein